jgi:leucyl aminopeptidase
MDVQVKVGAIRQVEADAIIVNLFEGAKPGGATGTVDKAMGGAITALVEAGDFSGKAGQVAVLYPHLVPSPSGDEVSAGRVIIAGLGEQEKFSAEAARRAMGVASRKARELGAKSVATILHGAGAGGLSPEDAAQATVEGATLGLYKWRGLKTGEDELGDVELLTLAVFDEAQRGAAQAGADAAGAVAAGVMLARDLVNNPPNVATPTMLAETAHEIAERFGMRLEVFERADMEKLGMGAFLGVARGTHEPPKFIVLEHNPGAEGDTVVLVGKGITFDTGGINLKSGEHMASMKTDMGGAAAVLGTMRVVGALNLPLHVVGLVPATDNMPGGSAYKPSDVVKALNGKTIEVMNTDAEGRMILADALCYANRFEPAAVIDLATLTGACVVALGAGMAAGLFCEADDLREKLLAAAGDTFERLWHMPLYPEYFEAIKSDTADIKNIGGRMGGVGTSAMFLRQFAEGYPWAHLDVAGMVYNDRKDLPYHPKGATGFGVRLLAQMLRNW